MWIFISLSRNLDSQTARWQSLSLIFFSLLPGGNPRSKSWTSLLDFWKCLRDSLRSWWNFWHFQTFCSPRYYFWPLTQMLSKKEAKSAQKRLKGPWPISSFYLRVALELAYSCFQGRALLISITFTQRQYCWGTRLCQSMDELPFPPAREPSSKPIDHAQRTETSNLVLYSI